VRQAIDLLEGHPERSWTPTEIAAAVSVSVRYLQEGFQRSAGVSPMTYLGELRLARVHGELTRATSESETVTQVATRWGFVHLGRFSAACGRKYGRRPSDTLRDLSAN
jgi:transcriptional regulator GlxA family with amidase domain